MNKRLHEPPKFFLRFFRSFCHPELKDHIEGDLTEVYREHVNSFGRRKANRKFIIDVLLLFRPGIIRPVEGYKNLNHYGMYKSYFKIGWRNLLRNKGYSLINISGLALGMAVAMLIGMWVYDELSVNKYHQNYERIAKVMQHVTNNGEVQTVPVVPYPLASELRKKYGSDFKHIILAKGDEWRLLAVDDKKITKLGTFAEPDIIKLLGLKMVKGTSNCLTDPTSIVLSASLAKSFFGENDPLNQLIRMDNHLDVKVTGVYEDLPSSSACNSIAFLAPWDLYFNNAEWIRTATTPWRPNAFQIYVQLNENVKLENASFKIKDAKLKNVNSELAKKKPELFLHPMSKWHLYSDFKDGFNIGGRVQYVWLFSIIGAFVLILACINFMNLSTARSEKRSKEVGIRKAMGSKRESLISQFFCESLLVTFFAFVASIILVQLSLPFFNDIAGKKIEILWSSPWFWLVGIGFSLITGLISGAYPAIYLSSFQPMQVLKGVFRVGRFALMPRKILVLFQYTVSITLIIGTIVVFRQIQFAQSRPLGYDKNGLVIYPQVADNIHKHFDAVKNELIKTRAVTGVAEAANPTTEFWSTTSGFDWPGKDPALSTDIANVGVSHDYGKIIEWQIKEGRDFSTEFASDSTSIILNEAAVKFMGLKNPVGETIKWFGTPFTVVGVVKDLVVQSPYQQIGPSVYYITRGAENFVLVRIAPTISVKEALQKIEVVFKKYNPSSPIDYQFVDEEYAKKFNNEERISKLATVFAILAIFISSLGLFGLASFVVERRTKEIGIRKIVGASIVDLWTLLSKDFVMLVFIACLIAIPTGYYIMSNWLSRYAYHTELSWWIFAITCVGALIITLLTVSYQAIRSALTNPVESLR